MTRKICGHKLLHSLLAPERLGNQLAETRGPRGTVTSEAVGEVSTGRADEAARPQQRALTPRARVVRRHPLAPGPGRGGAAPAPPPALGEPTAPASPAEQGRLAARRGRLRPPQGSAGAGGTGRGGTPATVPGPFTPSRLPGTETGEGSSGAQLSPTHPTDLRCRGRKTERRGGAPLPPSPARPGGCRSVWVPRWEPSPPEPALSPWPGEERERRGLGEESGSGRGEPVIGLLTINRHDPRGGPYQVERRQERRWRARRLRDGSAGRGRWRGRGGGACGTRDSSPPPPQRGPWNRPEQNPRPQPPPRPAPPRPPWFWENADYPSRVVGARRFPWSCPVGLLPRATGWNREQGCQTAVFRSGCGSTNIS